MEILKFILFEEKISIYFQESNKQNRLTLHNKKG